MTTIEALQIDREAVLAETEDLRLQRDQIVQKIQPLELQLASVNAEIAKINGTRLVDIDNQIGRVAISQGALVFNI